MERSAVDRLTEAAKEPVVARGDWLIFGELAYVARVIGVQRSKVDPTWVSNFAAIIPLYGPSRGIGPMYKVLGAWSGHSSWRAIEGSMEEKEAAVEELVQRMLGEGVEFVRRCRGLSTFSECVTPENHSDAVYRLELLACTDALLGRPEEAARELDEALAALAPHLGRGGGRERHARTQDRILKLRAAVDTSIDEVRRLLEERCRATAKELKLPIPEIPG
jgi:hypothetical protein